MRYERLTTAAIALTVASSLHAQTHVYVDDDAPAGGDGLSWNSAFNDLQDAIDLAETLGASRGEIRVAGGTYTPGRQNPFQIAAPTESLRPFRLFGGFAGLESPTDPDARDVNTYRSVIDADIDGNDDTGDTSDNAFYLLIIDESSQTYGAPISAVILDGLSFRGAVDGCIRSSGGSSFITINRCTIEDTGVSGSEALRVEWDVVELDGCVFRNNDTGAIWSQNSELTVSNCVFQDNVAPEGGAIRAQSGDVWIESCLFERNNGLFGAGGAIWAKYADLHITQSVFELNEADSGGAVFSDSAATTVQDSVFTENNARIQGGAIFTDHSITLTGTQFTGNTALEGGAFHGQGSISLCSFTGNAATSDDLPLTRHGGAVYSNGYLSVDDSEFDANTAGKGGAAYGTHVLNINNCTLDNNAALSEGGALYSVNSIRDSRFENNTAASSGGAVFDVSEIHDSQFAHNAATTGGAIFDAGAIISCTLEQNSAEEGGAIHVPADQFTSITDSVFYDNYVLVSGSAIHSLGNFDLVRCTVSQSDTSAFTPLIEMRDGVGWIESSIVWDRRSEVFPLIKVLQDASLSVVYSAIKTDLISVLANQGGELVLLGKVVESDPVFTDLESGDLSLKSGSPCIDAGLILHISDLPARDATGAPRLVLDDQGIANTGFGESDAIEIGALEFHGTTCLADTNRDGTVAPNDFTAWLGAYTTLDPIADQNRDGYIDPGDFTAWINNYVIGCP